jgi:hypothetical protein
MDPLSLLCRLATKIPPPRMHVVHYAGVLAPAAKLRPLIVPPPPPPSDGDAAKPKDKSPTHRCAYIPWAILAKKTFKGWPTPPAVPNRVFEANPRLFPLHVEYDFVGAFAVASLLTLLALVTLIIKKVVEHRQASLLEGAER